MEVTQTVLVALVGLAIGSFLNVVIYRVPRGQLVRKGRSKCPQCGRQLRWYHNIPVISFIVLKGRCAFCGKKISPRYPAVELLNMLMYLYFYWQFGPAFDFLVFSILGSALLAIFFIDLDFKIIPDVITLPGMAAGLIISLAPGGMGILQSVIGLAAGGGVLYVIALLGDWMFKKESMGGGDVKMAAMLGSFLGWQKVLFIFLSSAVIGLLVSLSVMIFSKKLREERIIPFGPFLALAAMLAILYGDTLINYYLVAVAGIR